MTQKAKKILSTFFYYTLVYYFEINFFTINLNMKIMFQVFLMFYNVECSS